MGRRLRYEDLPPQLKAQVDAVTGKTQSNGAARRGRRQPNRTEAAYREERLGGRSDVASIYYEGLTFRMANGHRYTPDWVVVMESGEIECHEVKGGYALHSHQRARLAFDQARVEFPWCRWVWATKSKQGWKIEA